VEQSFPESLVTMSLYNDLLYLIDMMVGNLLHTISLRGIY